MFASPGVAGWKTRRGVGFGRLILVAIPALLIGVVSLGGFFGRWFWPMDLATSFRPQYAVGLLVAGAVLVWRKWRRLGWAILMIGLVNAFFVAPLFWGKQDVPPESPLLRVVSVNILGQNQEYEKVMGFLEQVDADVVFIHEANRLWENALSEAIGGGRIGYQLFRSRPDHLIFATLVLASQPLSEVISHGWAESEARAVEVIADLGDTKVTLLGIHPLAPTNRRRAALRDAQFEFVSDWAGETTGPTVVTGDFNATPWSHVFGPLADAGLRNSQRGYGLSTSFPVGGSFLTSVSIDHLLHSSHLLVADRWLGPDIGSDHFPLVVDLALSSPPG